MVGIFLGIQVIDWNDSQKDRDTEQQYIERSQQELIATQKDMFGLINYFHQVKNIPLQH